jgi:hypothetical protein
METCPTNGKECLYLSVANAINEHSFVSPETKEPEAKQSKI